MSGNDNNVKTDNKLQEEHLQLVLVSLQYLMEQPNQTVVLEFGGWNDWRALISTSTKFCTSDWDVVSVSCG